MDKTQEQTAEPMSFGDFENFLYALNVEGRSVEEVEKCVRETTSLKYDDEDIDDGLDDGDYLIYRSYTVGDGWWLKVYFPQSTRVITDWALTES